MIIAPSILNCNFANLSAEIEKVKYANLLHLDIMDGHFVNNISFGPKVVADLSKITSIPFDIHLMISKPLQYIDNFITKNTKYITIHREIENFDEVFNYLLKYPINIGIAISPKTGINSITPYLSKVSHILVMSVEPGFGGQKFIDSCANKVDELNKIRTTKGYNFLIEVDGGIDIEKLEMLDLMGADIVVMGSYLFNNNPSKILLKYKENR